MKLTFVLNILILTSVLVSCKTKVEVPEDFDLHKELYKPTFSALVDSVVKMGVSRSQIILPDSFLSVRVHTVNSGWVLNEEGKILDEYICHADYPDFQKKVVDELPSARVSEDITKEFHTYLKHMMDAEGRVFQPRHTNKYTLYMYVNDGEKWGGKPFSFYFDEVKGVQSDSVAVYYIFPENYREFGLSSFEFSKRRVSYLLTKDYEFSDEVLEGYGLKPKD